MATHLIRKFLKVKELNLHALTVVLSLALIVVFLSPSLSNARNPIRRTFFDIYPQAKGTQLDDLPSNAGHCGVCHFDFNGGGPRNFYGLAVEIGINNGLSNREAILAIDGVDSDGDGFLNGVEAADIVNFLNTPTFPGLTSSNIGNVLNVDLADIEPFLTPAGSNDTVPPSVEVYTPTAGENLQAGGFFSINFSTSDASGISHINVFLSEDGGSIYKPVAMNEPPSTGYSWFVPNLPGNSNLIKVEAYDNAGNPGASLNPGVFSITATPSGYVPSTLRDMEMPGTQPHEGAILDDPDASCATCHGNYSTDVEPWFNWRGSMMSQAMRDKLFLACMTVAEQDAPSVGDICIRCHTPGGWEEGRSVDTGGGMINVKDRHGVQCDFCHRVVDFNYQEGVSPPQDVDVLASLSSPPFQYANGEFINDPQPLKRGPYADVQASHAFVQSPIHLSSNMCGICHDVSNPVFSKISAAKYNPNAFDEKHPDMDLRNMFPIERTFSEWSRSEYAASGVYAPQFAGNKADGIVSTCQDCHMHDVSGKGANESGVNGRSDLALHDFTGGNTFMPYTIADFFPDEVNQTQLDAAVLRARSMLQKAATLEVTPEDFGVTVKVTNETGHKLPSGYPEGRRIWLNVKAYDAAHQLVFESGHYDYIEAQLIEDSQLKVYEIQPGISTSLASSLGLTPGKSFHFVLNDTVYFDNRIPPRGFTNAAFEEIQSAPVGYHYEDGQYWDITPYYLPSEAESVVVTLFYQTTTREYVEFLRDENTTNSAGQDMYNTWVAHGKSAPEVMATARVAVNVVATDTGDLPPIPFTLEQNYPNPFNPVTTINYAVAEKVRVRIEIFTVDGKRVRTLVNDVQEPSRYSVKWYGKDDNGQNLASGIYLVRFIAGQYKFTRKAVLLR